MNRPLLLCCTLAAAITGWGCGVWLLPERATAATPAETSRVQAGAAPEKRQATKATGPLADFARRVREAPLPELQSMAGELALWPDAWLRREARGVLYQRMAELDPAAALTWAHSRPGGDKEAFVQFLQSWAEVDPDGAIEATYAEASPVRAKEHHGIMMAHLATVNPVKFFAHAKSPPYTATHDVFTRAMQTMARRNPAAARKEYESLDVKTQARLTGPLAEGWARADPQGALAWARGLKEPARQGAVFGIITEIGPRDPLTALRETEVYLESDGYSHDAPPWVLKAIARGLARTDPDKALEWVTDHSNGEEMRRTIGFEVLPAIAAAGGPETGVRIVNALGQMDDSTMAGGLKNFLSTWQPDDPAAQMDLLAALPHTDSWVRVTGHITDVWAHRDPATVLQRARETDVAGGRYTFAGALGNLYNDTRNMDGFLDVLPLLNPKFKKGFVGTMAKRLAWESRGAAETFVSQLTPGSEERHSAIEGMTGFLGQQYPEQALAWADTLPDKEKAFASTSVMKEWAAQDPLAASQWLQAMPPGDCRDGGVVGLAVSLAVAEPDSAFVWIQTMENAEARELVYGAVLRPWAQSDPAAARQSIEDARISNEMKARLRAQFDVFHQSTR